MSDEESSEDPGDFPPNDPTSALDRLDADIEDLAIPDESSTPLSQREIDELLEQVIAEELARLNGTRCEK
ncbi:MAG TPA: hypothetical protein VGX68_27545 [Thermoanaerobaculia bacterium]|jgi:hypothetical protein|nr:hypothetical protein [Thermoanaerobaculia bacterium]